MGATKAMRPREYTLEFGCILNRSELGLFKADGKAPVEKKSMNIHERK